LLFPAVRLACLYPVRLCPGQVSFAGYVLPSGPSPCGRLSRPPTTMPDKTPRWHTAAHRLPGCSLFHDSTRAHAVPGLITLSCPNTGGLIMSLHPGAFGASWVLQRICSCMPRPEDSGGPPRPRHDGRFVLPSAPLKTSASATSLFRSCTSSSGSAISPAAYKILCLRLVHLVRDLRRSAMDPRLDTGGWLALPGEPLDSSFPTGTFTRQDALSFSQRDNASPSARPRGRTAP